MKNKSSKYVIFIINEDNGRNFIVRNIDTKEEVVCSHIVIKSVTSIYGTNTIHCEGFLKIEKKYSFITVHIDSVKENNPVLRHLYKTISYRVFSTAITVLTANVLGVPMEMSIVLGVGEFVFKPVFYFVHERVWYRVKMN
jgi:uncharacterized membrane protein